MGRIPSLGAPNAWSVRLAARRARGGGILDLTEMNPTRAGLAGDPADPARAALGHVGLYEPVPLGLEVAREAVARAWADRGVRVTPGHIALTASTSEAYAHLFRLLGEPGDAVLVPVPSYPLFEPIARLTGLRAVPFRLGWDGAWHLDDAALEHARDERTRAVVIVQPNLPTGSWLDAGAMARLTSWCAAHRLAVVADEVFAEYPWDPARSIPSFAGRDEALTFTLGGLSKTCGLPQLKLSWIAVSGPAAERDRALAGLEWIADLFLSVATPVQAALPALLAGRAAFQARVRDRIAANLTALRALPGRAASLDVLPGGAGWAAVLRLPARRSGEAWALDLIERGVLVHPGDFYDFAGEAFLVVSLLPEPEVFARGLGLVADMVEE